MTLTGEIETQRALSGIGRRGRDEDGQTFRHFLSARHEGPGTAFDLYRYDHDHSLVTLRSLPDWTFAPRWSSNRPLQSSLCKETRWPVDTSNRRHGRSALYSLIRCPKLTPCRHGLSQERSTEFAQHWPGLVSLMISVSRPQFWVSETLTLYKVLDWTVHMARIIKCVEVLRPMYYHFTDFLPVRASRLVSLLRAQAPGGTRYPCQSVFPLNRSLQSGHGYRCFCSPDKLSATRERLARAGSNSTYDKACLHLTEEEVARRVRAGEKSIVRLNVCCRLNIDIILDWLYRTTGSLHAFRHTISSLEICAMLTRLYQPIPFSSSPTCSLLTTSPLSLMTMRWASPT